MTHSPELEWVARWVLGDKFGDLATELPCLYFTHRDPHTGEPIRQCPEVAAAGSHLCPSHTEDLADIAWDRTRDAQEVDRG